jgi:tetratricopeptide (TPR) repeat protein
VAVIGSNPVNTSVRAEELFESENFKAALEEFKKIVDKNPNDAIVLQRIAQCYGMLGNYDKAASAAKQAIEMDAGLSIPHTILAFIRMRNNHSDEGHAEALAAYNIAPESADSLYCYGSILTTQDRLEEGIHLLEKARALEPKRFEIRNNLAIAYVWSGNYSKYWEEAKFLFRHKPSMKYGLRLLDAFQRKYALLISVMGILAIFGALILKMRVLLILPAIPDIEGLLYSYRLLKEHKLRDAIANFIAYLLLAILLGLVYYAI